MRNINSKNCNKNLFELKKLKGDLDEDVEEILKSFSTYLNNYDEDYYYNYKFIISHINSFLMTWKNVSKLNQYCEKIKRKIIDSNFKLLETIKINDNASLCIKLNDSIEICSQNKNKNGYIKVIKNELPPMHTIKYKDVFDIEILFKFDRIEYQRNYNKVFIREVIKKNQMSKEENKGKIVSIIKVLNEILDEFANYIILRNKLDKIISCLDNFDYGIYDVSRISFNFGNVFIYNPLKYKEENTRYSTNAFRYVLKEKSVSNIKNWWVKFKIEDKNTKKERIIMEEQKSIEDFKRKFKIILNQY